MKKKLPQSAEKWVKIVTNEETPNNDYYFSNYGQVKSIHRVTEVERFLKGSRDQYGFVKINLKLIKKKRQSFYLHRLIAKEFLAKPREDRKYIVHIDGDKENNYFKNLKWLNRDELTAFHLELGVYDTTTRKGIKRYKLTESKVRLLKRRLKSKKTKAEIIARDFDIAPKKKKKKKQ